MVVSFLKIGSQWALHGGGAGCARMAHPMLYAGAERVLVTQNGEPIPRHWRVRSIEK
jgi:hypothetical protein